MSNVAEVLTGGTVSQPEVNECQPAAGARTVSLYHGDCLEVMDRLAPASVDLILADLPYGITACPWDKQLPLDPLWADYKRLLKPGGVVILFAVQPYTSELVMSSPSGWFWCEWIWEKTKATDPLHARWRPLRAHENILVFSPKRTAYNPQMTTGHRPVRGYEAKRSGSRIGQIYGVKGGPAPKSVHAENPTGTRYPRSVLRHPHDRHAWHGTQKSVNLLRYLIRTYTKPGETVMDNVMGSGSTGAAAVMERRSFIGIEQDTDFFRRAVDRVQMQAAWSFEDWRLDIEQNDPNDIPERGQIDGTTSDATCG